MSPADVTCIRRVDRWTGDTRFIYHGNDGTSFPWNDTAQLDFTRADVREAVIQTILGVARRFPIIRFDAAMTLAVMALYAAQNADEEYEDARACLLGAVARVL